MGLIQSSGYSVHLGLMFRVLVLWNFCVPRDLFSPLWFKV